MKPKFEKITNPQAKRVSFKSADGKKVVEMSVSKFNKLVEKQETRERTLLTVCRKCWASSLPEVRNSAHLGTMVRARDIDGNKLNDELGNKIYVHEECR